MAAKKLRYGVLGADGAWKLEPTFEKIGWASDGRVPFAEGKKWGYAAFDGTIVVPPAYDFAYAYAGKVACAEVGGTWSAFNLDGTPAAGWRGNLIEGRIRTCVGAWPSRDHFEPRTVTRRFGFVDENDQVIADPVYSQAGDFRNGRAMVRLVHSSDNPHGQFAYLGLDGQIAVQPFDAFDARAFGADGRARVKGTNGTWRFIDRDGAVVLETPFTEVSPFSEDRAMVKSYDKKSAWGNELVGFIDPKGEVVIERQFEQAQSFQDGLAAVRVHVGSAPTWGFIDATGKTVVEPTFRDVRGFCGEVAPACVPSKAAWSSNAWGLIDRTGAWRVEPTFAAILPFIDGAARFRRDDGTWGLFDRRGEVIADGYAALDYAFPCAANKGGKQKANGGVTGGKWGFVDAAGTEVIACTHAAVATGFSKGLAGVGDKVAV